MHGASFAKSARPPLPANENRRSNPVRIDCSSNGGPALLRPRRPPKPLRTSALFVLVFSGTAALRSRPGLVLSAAQLPALLRHLSRGARAHQSMPHPRQLRKIVVRAQGHLPDIAGSPVDRIPPQRLIRSWRAALANDDEAEKPRHEFPPQVHAVHLDMRVAQIDPIVVRHQQRNLVRLPLGQPASTGCRANGGHGSHAAQQQTQEEPASLQIRNSLPSV